MKIHRWLMVVFALGLAGALAFADLGWAQCRGYGNGYGNGWCAQNQGYQASPTGWQGRGPGYANCPNYSETSYRGPGSGNYGRGSGWGRRGGRYNSADSQTPATPAPQTNQ